MNEQNTFEIGFSNGIVIGIAFNKDRFQIAFIAIIIQLNFNVVGAGLKRFRECLKEN